MWAATPCRDIQCGGQFSLALSRAEGLAPYLSGPQPTAWLPGGTDPCLAGLRQRPGEMEPGVPHLLPTCGSQELDTGAWATGGPFWGGGFEVWKWIPFPGGPR